MEKPTNVSLEPAREPSPSPQPTKSGDERPGDRDTGAALRSVYQKTVDETVPDEMLDLLGKLR